MTRLQTQKLTVADYQTAIDAQAACSLSAIVRCLADMMPKIWQEARDSGMGTDWVNQHPICRLFAEQIWFLTGAASNMSEFRDAWDEAEAAITQLRAIETAEILRDRDSDIDFDYLGELDELDCLDVVDNPSELDGLDDLVDLRDDDHENYEEWFETA